MNNKVIFSAVLSALALGSAVAQEYDDMYFTKKDRAKLQVDRGVSVAFSEKKKKADADVAADEEINPTDSYSSRNVNPEYTSRANSQTAQADNEDYFVSNYRYNNSYSNFNNNFNNWYNNPWYTSAYWGPGMNSWNSPYYGYYDSWASPFGNPYYRSGMYSSMSMWYGSSWNYGWGSGLGMNGYYDPWYSPWGMSPYFGMSPAWGMSYAYSPYAGWYRTPRVVVIDRSGQGVVYGKRSSRSSGVVQTSYGNTNARTYSNTGSGSRSDRGARVSSSSTRQSDYYEPWRNQSRSGSTSGSNSSSPSRTSTWDNNNSSPSRTSTWDNSNSRSTSRQASPAPSRTYDGGSRSSGGSSGGSSGSRSSRGRGN